jgi:hypothetical protein
MQEEGDKCCWIEIFNILTIANNPSKIRSYTAKENTEYFDSIT